MPPQALAAVATLLGFAAHGDRIELRLDHGSAELQWYAEDTPEKRQQAIGWQGQPGTPELSCCSTNGPRATLTSTAPGFIRPSTPMSRTPASLRS